MIVVVHIQVVLAVPTKVPVSATKVRQLFGGGVIGKLLSLKFECTLTIVD